MYDPGPDCGPTSRRFGESCIANSRETADSAGFYDPSWGARFGDGSRQNFSILSSNVNESLRLLMQQFLSLGDFPLYEVVAVLGQELLALVDASQEN